MELNTDIWGTQSEWTLDTDTFSATNSPYPAYTGKYKYLKDYRAAQVFNFGEEIDNTVLYCGQAAEVSPLGGAAAFYYNDTFEGVPEPYIQRNEIVSTFLASVGNSQTQHTDLAVSTASSALTSILYYKGAVQGADNTRWIIDGGEYITGNEDWYNVANMCAPIVDFDPKCLFGVIYVVAGNETNGVTKMTLHQLETGNYSDYKIYRAFMQIAAVYSVSGSLPHLTSFREIYYNSTSNKKGYGIIDYTPWEVEGKQYVNYIQNASPLNNYPSIPLFGFDLSVDRLYHYDKFGFSWRSYHDVSNDSERDWANEFSQAPIFYGATYATFTDVYAEKYTNYTDISFIGYMSNTTENRENIRKMAACYGIYFTEYNYSEDSTLFDDDNRYTNAHMNLGLLRDGIGYGEYTTGAGNVDNPAYNWTSNHESGYDPAANIDPNTYSDTTAFNTVSYQNTMTKRYLLNSTDVGRLAAELWSAQADKPADIDFTNYVLDEYLTNNPIDTIVSLKYFPCKFPDQNVAVVYLGKYQTNITTAALSTTVKVIDFDPIMVYPHYGDYRDFEPYTTLQIYIPFCGVIAIPTAEAMGRYVAVKLCIDVSTGACAGYVIVSQSGTGGICVATATGTAAIDIPVSGLQSANLAQAIFNATSNWTQTQVTTGRVTGGIFAHSDSVLGTIARGFATSGISAGSIVGGLRSPDAALSAATGLIDKLDLSKAMQSGMVGDISAAKADYELSHIQMPIRMIGSTAPALSSVLESSVRLIIYRPITDETALSQYADTVGYACLKSGVVSDFTGYTTGTIDVSGINASSEEQQLIARAFATGVYL